MYYTRGLGLGFRHGFGGWYDRRVARPTTPSGYRYVGPCRCGNGPHAFYETPEGRVVPAYEVFSSGYTVPYTREDLKAEKRYIEEEMKHLEERLNEIKDKLEKEQKKGE